MSGKFTTVRLLTRVRNKLDKTRKHLSGARRKMSLSDAAEVALDALNSMPCDQQERIIEGKSAASATS